MSKKISTLAVGAKVRDLLSKYYGVPVGFQIADKNHAGYPANSTTLAAEKILCLKAFDARESGGNSDRQDYGNNRYSLANIRQWLNKSGTNWYQAQHSYDRAPGSSYVWNGYNAYDTEAGFKTGFSPQFLAAILPTTLTVAKPTTDGGGSETVTDDFFLPSKQEVGLGSENGIAEGSLLALFNSNNSSRLRTCTPQAIANSNYTNNPSSAANWIWRLRSPNSGYAYSVRSVNSDGSEINYIHYASLGSVGVLPLCNLSSDTLVSDEPDSEGYYTIQWNQAPTTPPRHHRTGQRKERERRSDQLGGVHRPRKRRHHLPAGPMEQQHERMDHDLHRQQHQLYRHRHHHDDGQRAVARPREG